MPLRAAPFHLQSNSTAPVLKWKKAVTIRRPSCQGRLAQDFGFRGQALGIQPGAAPGDRVDVAVSGRLHRGFDVFE